ncbi:elongator complex protein 2-like isoform X2 [Daphnia carinata]|uniref:elongator complex protein 2-like isoform X2 n=1 Tax=Daphnia carinata TaxID=120202 RepID=UPI00257C23B9|nr:elongator complex protein 2-like isoform X2 [Daphnia carinata]
MMAGTVNNVVVGSAYTSVGCNRTPHALDWGNNNLVCFAASRAVAVYDPKFAGNHGKILHTLYEHEDRVNCVRWIQDGEFSPEKEILSGSADKTVIVWAYSETSHDVGCQRVSKLIGLDASVNSVDGFYWKYNHNVATVVVAVGGDQICVWLRGGQDDEWKLQQKFSTKPVLMFDCVVNLLQGCEIPLIACAGDDGSVQLFNFQILDKELSCVRTMKIPGHEDWVRALAFTAEDGGDLLLASAAQDTLIRVWRISPESSKDKCDGDKLALQSNQGQFSIICEDELKFKCQLETVLQGHENWVYGLHWQPSELKDGCRKNPLKLLSCSMDKTMTIWGADPSSGIWFDQVRVGEVGGNTLGLYGCRFGNQGTSILAHGYQGALHLWHDIEGQWQPGVVCSGHFDSVDDFIWDCSGDFAITVSIDQTSRLHAPWIQESNEEITWHELSRPQIHGYDLSCITSLGRFRFASGAEEKVIRVFEAPHNFLENFARICHIDVPLPEQSAPQGAAVPALGLSNKPIYQTDGPTVPKNAHSKSDLYAENHFTPTLLMAPPTEETLLQNTLWPEVQKLYGHGYELFSLAADPQCQLLVSASKAQKSEHASIIIWDTSNWSLIGKLEAHALTVSQMAFSPDGQKLVSVSRDRNWAVHEKVQTDEGKFTLKTVAKGSGGSRILWSCHWFPDSRCFVTGSRDKRVIVWEPVADDTLSYRISGQPLECADSVTAVACGPSILPNGCFLIAIGLDNGQIQFYNWTPAPSDSIPQWELLATLNQSQAHHRTVKRLRFRPVNENDASKQTLQLASCGADNTFKIFNLAF